MRKYIFSVVMFCGLASAQAPIVQQRQPFPTDNRPSPSFDEIKSTLDIVHMAFQHPESIIEPVNQKPRAALFLLQHLASTTSDGLLAERITSELGFLRAAMAAPTRVLSTPKQ
jgi:hypothetical protein